MRSEKYPASAQALHQDAGWSKKYGTTTTNSLLAQPPEWPPSFMDHPSWLSMATSYDSCAYPVLSECQLLGNIRAVLQQCAFLSFLWAFHWHLMQGLTGLWSYPAYFFWCSYPIPFSWVEQNHWSQLKPVGHDFLHLTNQCVIWVKAKQPLKSHVAILDAT